MITARCFPFRRLHVLIAQFELPNVKTFDFFRGFWSFFVLLRFIRKITLIRQPLAPSESASGFGANQEWAALKRAYVFLYLEKSLWCEISQH